MGLTMPNSKANDDHILDHVEHLIKPTHNESQDYTRTMIEAMKNSLESTEHNLKTRPAPLEYHVVPDFNIDTIIDNDSIVLQAFDNLPVEQQVAFIKAGLKAKANSLHEVEIKQKVEAITLRTWLVKTVTKYALIGIFTLIVLFMLLNAFFPNNDPNSGGVVSTGISVISDILKTIFIDVDALAGIKKQ